MSVGKEIRLIMLVNGAKNQRNLDNVKSDVDYLMGLRAAAADQVSILSADDPMRSHFVQSLEYCNQRLRLLLHCDSIQG